jgi:hypothetical protein
MHATHRSQPEATWPYWKFAREPTLEEESAMPDILEPIHEVGIQVE